MKHRMVCVEIIEEQLATLLCRRYTVDHFPELASIAEKLEVDSNRLMDRYTTLSVYENLKLSPAILQGIFSTIEKGVVQSQIPQIRWWLLLHSEWELLGADGPKIKDERALDLPVLTHSKRGRAGR